MKTTMWAYVIEEFGDAQKFKRKEVAVPLPKENHILIEVRATSLNPVDLKIRSGIAAGIAPEFPAILHGDVAGVVVRVDPSSSPTSASPYKVGDEVYGCVGGVKGSGGALAEYVLADVALLAPKPKSLSFHEAAALPLVGITAWEALIKRAKVQPGQKVLVHAATGGVGHMGVQLAKWAGAKVYSTASTEEKIAIGKKLGAKEVINYKKESVETYVKEHTHGEGFDVVFDTLGGDNLIHSFEAAKLNGTVVSISTLNTFDLSLMHFKALTLHVVFMLIPLLHNKERIEHGKILTELSKLVDEGKVKPLIDPEIFAFEDVDKAHAHLESGKAIGKIVLKR